MFYGRSSSLQHRTYTQEDFHNLPVISPVSSGLTGDAWSVFDTKLEQVISLVQTQTEETKAMKEEVVSLRAEVENMKQDYGKKAVGSMRRPKLPTDVSVSLRSVFGNCIINFYSWYHNIFRVIHTELYMIGGACLPVNLLLSTSMSCHSCS